MRASSFIPYARADSTGHSFLPYDFARQGRKSWFVSETGSSIAGSSSKEAVTRLATPASPGLQKIGLADQPLSEMISRPDLGTASSIQASLGEDRTDGDGDVEKGTRRTGEGSRSVFALSYSLLFADVDAARSSATLPLSIADPEKHSTAWFDRIAGSPTSTSSSPPTRNPKQYTNQPTAL